MCAIDSHRSNFNPRSPCGERPRPSGRLHRQGNFNPRSPCGERPVPVPSALSGLPDFNPRSPCGERPLQHLQNRAHAKFQSTLSLRRATNLSDSDLFISVFQSTLSLRRATPERFCNALVLAISIHALLAESDTGMEDWLQQPAISIHALLAESDPASRLLIDPGTVFQSTLSLRRATAFFHTLPLVHLHFNPRSPCGERHPASLVGLLSFCHFNPRSPCGERPPP